MLFNSLTFVFFFLLFLLGWIFVRRHSTPRWIYITIASLIFYGWWDWRFLFLIIGSGLIDYWAGLLIVKYPERKKVFFILSMAGNLGSLAIFKYAGFIAGSLDHCSELVMGRSLGLHDHLPAFTLVLPVGISFYTFQSMSYTIDVYRGRLLPVRNIFHFFSFLVMFPQLVAGPIVRAKELLNQLATYRPVSSNSLWTGIKLFVFGLFQKVVIADNLARFVDAVYGGTAPVQGALVWWAATLAFAFQIYCDFSGYSLMARGLARVIGFRFKMNFNQPYTASSLRSFWTKWHISLSTWFRDYVYVPLGGNRKGLWQGLLFMSITMALSGLWHGANWTFLAWGGIHALALATERIWGNFAPFNIRFGRSSSLFGWIFTMVTVLIGWVFFRSSDISSAAIVIKELFSFHFDTSFIKYFKAEIFFLSFAIMVEFVLFFISLWPRSHFWYRSAPIADSFVVALMATCCVFLRGPSSDFIYFQF